MFLRIASAIFVLALSLSSFGQSPTVVVAKKTTPVTDTHHAMAATTPPLKNITSSPKEINKKKRKSTHVTVAGKPRQEVVPAAK